ncbi:IS66 family transposase, partial [Acinetobacter sp. YH16049]
LQQQVLHADETPVTIMRMGENEKKPKKGYVWAYATTQYNPVQAVIYDFQDSRSGQHAEAFLKDWQGHLVCDDYSGYKARFKSGQVIEVGCMAHARRKFHELHVTKKSQVAEQALVLIQKLYAIEAELRKKTDGTAEQRREYRQQHSQPVMQQLYEWLNQHQLTVPSSSPTAKAINYTLKRWPALSRYLDDGNLPICNNWVENQMRPWALGRKNWLFAGSLRSGQRAANIMTLIQSAKLNGLDPYAYLSDVLKRLPTHKVTQIEELLPHRWKPKSN